LTPTKQATQERARKNSNIFSVKLLRNKKLSATSAKANSKLQVLIDNINKKKLEKTNKRARATERERNGKENKQIKSVSEMEIKHKK
jgi:hypothetical protein